MEITITLPADHSATTIQELLEREWLVPKKFVIFCVPEEMFG